MYISKVICLLGDLQRGLDQSHPEFKVIKSESISRTLKAIITHVNRLEEQCQKAGITNASAKSIALEIHEGLLDGYSKERLLVRTKELIATLNGEPSK